jgi:hypothetical protein
MQLLRVYAASSTGGSQQQLLAQLAPAAALQLLPGRMPHTRPWWDSQELPQQGGAAWTRHLATAAPERKEQGSSAAGPAAAAGGAAARSSTAASASATAQAAPAPAPKALPGAEVRDGAHAGSGSISAHQQCNCGVFHGSVHVLGRHMQRRLLHTG